jgi:hypothetical protein
MLSEAKRLASEGRAVYVVAAHWKQLQDLIDDEMPRIGIKCEPDIPQNFDWQTMRVRGSHPNCVWLFDHWAIESNPAFAGMFRAMTQFDAD